MTDACGLSLAIKLGRAVISVLYMRLASDVEIRDHFRKAMVTDDHAVLTVHFEAIYRHSWTDSIQIEGSA
jgi:hypothetical protein